MTNSWAANRPRVLDRCETPGDPDACAKRREDLVAGTDEPFPDCPVHGPFCPDEEE